MAASAAEGDLTYGVGRSGLVKTRGETIFIRVKVVRLIDKEKISERRNQFCAKIF